MEKTNLESRKAVPQHAPSPVGETTPGPLIMVVAFVGFVGAWTKEVFGPDALLLAACAGAVVATFFTFLPSFVFIVVGGPLVESTHGELKFTAPLTGIRQRWWA